MPNKEAEFFTRPLREGDRVKVKRMGTSGEGTIKQISDELSVGGGTKTYKAFLVLMDDESEDWFSGSSLTKVSYKTATLAVDKVEKNVYLVNGPSDTATVYKTSQGWWAEIEGMDNGPHTSWKNAVNEVWKAFGVPSGTTVELSDELTFSKSEFTVKYSSLSEHTETCRNYVVEQIVDNYYTDQGIVVVHSESTELPAWNYTIGELVTDYLTDGTATCTCD